MNLFRRGRPLAVLTLFTSAAAALLGTITTETGCKKDADPPSADAPILIGVSLGLTNGLAAFSQPLRDAVRTAEGQINASGGLLGRTVTFDVRDDQSDETGDVVGAIANDFVARGAVAVIGPVGSQQVIKTQAIYAAAQMVQISPSATSTDLTTIQPVGNRWLFRTTPADDFQGAAVLLFAQRTPRGLNDAGVAPQVDGGPPSTCSKMAIVQVDNSYGTSMADVIAANFPKRGGTIVTRQKVSVTLADNYDDVINTIMPLTPDCLALISYDDVAATFVRNFKTDPRFAALNANGFFFIGTDGVFTDGFLTSSRQDLSDPKSANTAEGVYGTNPDTQPGTPEYNEFRTLFSSYAPLGRNPDNTPADAPAFAANTFDAAMLIALAIQSVGNTTDRVAIRNALFTVSGPPGKPYTPAELGSALLAVRNGDDIDYKGASGAVDLQPNGNVQSGFIVWEAAKDTTGAIAYKTVGRFALDELTAELQ